MSQKLAESGNRTPHFSRQKNEGQKMFYKKNDVPKMFHSALGYRNVAIGLWVIVVVALVVIALSNPGSVDNAFLVTSLLVMWALCFFGCLSWLVYRDQFANPYTWLVAGSKLFLPTDIAKMDKIDLECFARAILYRLVDEVKAAEANHPGDEYNDERIKAKRKFENTFDAFGTLQLINSNKGYGQFFR